MRVDIEHQAYVVGTLPGQRKRKALAVKTVTSADVRTADTSEAPVVFRRPGRYRPVETRQLDGRFFEPCPSIHIDYGRDKKKWTLQDMCVYGACFAGVHDHFSVDFSRYPPAVDADDDARPRPLHFWARETSIKHRCAAMPPRSARS